ncbi:unnamed protein product, partial [Sphagnum jensenii]
TCAGAASGSVPSSPREKAEFASPTTFVQADTSSFRELVQKLTGASDSDLEKKLPITPAIDSLSARRPSFKLHERRQSNIRKLEIKPGLSTATDVSEKTCYGPRTPTTTYESCYYTGLKSRTQNHLPEATERERHATPHFFLHPSPSSFDPTRPQPELLSLFPLTSPRATET